LCLFVVAGAQRLYSSPVVPLSETNIHRQTLPVGSPEARVTFVQEPRYPTPVPSGLASVQAFGVFAAAFLVGIAAKTAMTPAIAVEGRRVPRAREPVMKVEAQPGFWTGFKMAMPKTTPLGAEDRKARDRSLQFGLFSKTWETDQLMTRVSNGAPAGDERIMNFDQATDIVNLNRSLNARFGEVGKLEAAARAEMPKGHWNDSMKEHERSRADTVKLNTQAGVSTGFADPPRVKWNWDGTGLLGGMQNSMAFKKFKKLEPGAVIREGQEALFEVSKELGGVPVYPWKKMKAGADELKEYVKPPETSEPEETLWKKGTGRKGLIPTESKGPLPWEY